MSFKLSHVEAMIMEMKLKGARKRYFRLGVYRQVLDDYAKGRILLFPKPSVRNSFLEKPIFIAHLFTPKGLMISQYSQYLFTQMFEPYSDKEINDMIERLRNND